MKGVTVRRLCSTAGSCAVRATKAAGRTRVARAFWSMRWLVPLVGFFGLVASLWWLLNHHVFKSDDVWDTRIVCGIATVYAISAMIMLVWTRIWTVRGLGLLGTVLGDIGIYGTAALKRLGLYVPGDAMINLIRSFLVCGGLFLSVSFVCWFATEIGIRKSVDRDKIREEVREEMRVNDRDAR